MKLVRKRLLCLDIFALPIGVMIASQGDNILIRRRREIRCALVEGPGQGIDSFSIFKAHEDIAKCIDMGGYACVVGLRITNHTFRMTGH